MLIVKIGGGSTLNIKGIIKELSELAEPFIIVHGANSLRDKLADSLGIERKTVTSLSGYSSVLSDCNTIDLQMMAYAGLKNKRIVELCQQSGINAVGLSGLDGRIIQGRRNTGIKFRENGKKHIIRDYSGKPVEVNTTLMNLLVNNGFTPVLTVPIIDENGCAINSENDDIVAVLQNALSADHVIQFIEERGFLKNPDNPDSLISILNKQELMEWEQKVNGRIKRKLHALCTLIHQGVKKITIADGREHTPLFNALKGNGTVIS